MQRSCRTGSAEIPIANRTTRKSKARISGNLYVVTCRAVLQRMVAHLGLAEPTLSR